MSHSELPEARILADIREENPYIEDQLYDNAQFVLLDTFEARHATKFLIRNLDQADALLLGLALEGHPDHFKSAIRVAKKSSREHSNFIVELFVKKDSDKSGIQVLQECFSDLETLFQVIKEKATILFNCSISMTSLNNHTAIHRTEDLFNCFQTFETLASNSPLKHKEEEEKEDFSCGREIDLEDGSDLSNSLKQQLESKNFLPIIGKESFTEVQNIKRAKD